MMFKMFLILISFVSLLDLSVTQIVQPGQCDPNITLVNNFNVTEFFGKWHVLRRSSNPVLYGDCSTLEFNEQNGNLTVYKRSVINNFLNEINGSVTLENGTAKFAISISGFEEPLDFWILPTAVYSTNSLAYSCANINSTHRNIYLWQLSRDTSVSDMIEGNFNQTLVTLLGITIDSLPRVNHSETACTTLPDILPGEQVILPGVCNENMAVVQNFNVSSFMGTWHEISSYASLNEVGGCRRAEYQLSGSTVAVANREVVNQTLRIISGSANITSNDGSARLQVSLEVVPGTFSSRPLFVLATDYTSYAVSYTCVNLPDNQRRVNSWILSRSRTLSQEAQVAVDAVLRSEIELNNRFYVPTNQSDDDCFYFPVPVPGQPVTFPGQCDENIRAIPNFNATRYLGLWHNIESYPTTSINGTCPNALYTLGGDNVDVRNTQVIDQELSSITGSAIVNSTDGSGILLVSFQISPNITNTANYFVLDTDYDSYAVVYSCANINSEERRVTGFKLGRAKQLNSTALDAIDRAISAIPVMDQRYFVSQNQSEEDCFYYPEPEPGVPVVFPGMCDDDLNVVQNFNLAEFEGTWYEIQSYPTKEDQQQCVNHVLTLDSNTTFNGVTSSVFDQFQTTVNSTISLASNDGSARMTLTIRSQNNADIVIPFWILDTDYSNYALAYGCVNRDDGFRSVYSWKFSRTIQLSSSNITAIDNAMTNVTVLEERYFENKNHSDGACFYLPEIPSGDPVILNGQCDRNITVVQNFNASAYLGNWRLIESYASDFQPGSCNRANYALGANNTVVVTNTNVVNQTLATTILSAVILDSGKLLVELPGTNRSIEYWILDTDYSSYSLVYSCENLDNTRRRVWSWKLSRTRDLTSNAIQSINRVINSIDVLNNRYFEIMDHSDDGCFYFPTPDPNTPVIFPGQCDPNINVVTDFNAVEYLNLWHDIASYPSASQDGTCNNALYSLNANGTVDVFNTQVIDQTLDTINGVARLATNDSSAKLIVTFPAGVSGFVEAPYWVLDTDYRSYALVYSCVNINDETRAVWSWKLSRTKELSANASAAIDRIVDTIPVLDERYFNKKNQTDEGCFYYPEPQPGVPVVFPGSCENEINVLQNFNLTEFAGTWYEIQSYPTKEDQQQCVNHVLTLNSNTTFNGVTSSVFDQFQTTVNSTISLASNDGSARMTLTIRSQNNTDIVIPFWILDTDYSNYALAYGCVNRDDGFRSVYSWKFSRTIQLSSSNITAIDNAMTNVTVLEERYFENKNHSDGACFYLPEIPSGDPVILNGQCDRNISVVQNFNASAYLGNWRLIESYASDFQPGSCNRANYALGANNTVVVTNTNVVNQTLATTILSAVILDSGKLLVELPGTNRSIEYWILDTDYSSYSLVYSCENLDNTRRRVWSWKLSRTRDLTSNAIQSINRVINSIDVLNNRYFEIMDHSDDGCFYFPTPDPNTPVIFPGQCDSNINVVTDFNAVEYLNLWHDIASYPSASQDGTCNNALYSLNANGTVDVFNTQVIDQTLDTINGVARLATNDSSAKLIVTFPAGVSGFVEAPYWVLDTDYRSYALVYSCVNLNDETRAVWSWKLSRTKELSANASAAIDRIVDTIPVLDERYFNKKNQTDEGCFYYPEPQPGVVVEFPGQCGDVQAFSNFNMSLFEGVWHEIEAYPKEQQSGQCVNHNYTLTSTRTLNLVSRNVINQELGVTNSRVTFASNQETSGNLIITLNSGGQDITIPFIVLSTDYDNYALAYSCVNLPNDFRRVFSWKLSRSKILSNDSQVAINNAMANITVLRNKYYENVNQTDDACFYLPTPIPGEPVTFEGQCDENIQVVSNFSAVDYLGRWLLIESYPAPNQQGECNDATYSLNANGNTVDVYNTEVLNQQLLTINGSAILITNDGSAKLNVTFPNTTEAAPYWVLDTDYNSFALVYSCRNIDNNRRTVTSWKLSRTNTLTPTANARINQKISEINVLNDRYFTLVNRTDDACFYYPTPGSDSPVFRGLCNENITVVQNFNATAYLGLWYDIESYPVRFQYGTCPTATYEASDIGVNVYNTEVVDQRLSSIRGSAVIASTDGSAKLTVSFPVAGTNSTTTSPYWVLATDYNNFALVYSCVNVGDYSRRVSSWKLSRGKSLSVTSTSTINSVMDSVPVLNQMYYNTRGHSDENCFYYPDNNGGPVIQYGQCDSNLTVVNNFNINSFAGSWFEIARFPSELQNGECVYNNFTVNNQTLNIYKSIVHNERLTDLFGDAIVSQDGRGIITVNLTNEEGDTFATTFQVLDVDYNEFALLHNCRNVNNTHKQVYSWKLSRSQSGLSPAAVMRINQVVANTSELFEDYYDVTDQTVRGCFHYPDFEELPPSIILKGPCDETIRAKLNFNATAYLGKWYEIASYPQAFQNGECARAHYSAGNNVVNVVNTQVVNRTLDVQTATAVVASNDTSGLLNVTFILPNGVINVVNYYVLETDYTSFSLVYSCRNLDNGDRQVSSWKLSRETTLANHSVPIMDSIINNTQGLREEYYRTTSQSDEDCFYIPELDKNQAPVLRGQCQNITGMPGFDAQRYLGWWHEIASYPTDIDVGTCISSNFRINNNQSQVTDTNIFNVTSHVNTSNVTLGNDGRIRRILNNGEVIDIWVLTTDYYNYSLLYSCENLNNTHRRVWSAKHSKSRQLTAEAEIAMAPYIERDETLEPQFYIPIDQSDEGCFHYPEQSGAQIILPGQCDSNIPVMQNFEPAKYTGTWYQIEKYRQRFDNGSCVGARYTLDENTGVVDVLNWQVVDGELRTIEGNATIISTDGSGKLMVNLLTGSGDEVTVVSFELYVLKTDYITYSLAYSCANINEFQRSVGAWKLSRTRTMPSQAKSEIDAYMNSRQELHQPYFDRVEQNDNCEEPNSSYLIRSSAILVLICSVLRLLY